ncbi:MAG TPA: hypothetical protein VFR86_08370, partial [Burkholderiaceae bacterium]|nr:hypothetical protein [Burkholderiaceae bacterium]
METKRAWVGLLFPLVLLASVGAAAAAQPVAMLTDLQGKVEFATEARGRVVSLAAPLHTDDALQLGANARAVVAYPGAGLVYEVQGPGVVRIGPADVAVMKGATVSRSELPPQLRQLVQPGRAAQASIVLRSLQTRELTPVAPRGTQMAMHVRTLRWQPMTGADGTPWEYHVRLIDDNGAVVFSTQTQEPQVALPAEIALLRSQPYVWTVEARGRYGRRVESAAEFTLIDEKT